MNGNVMLSKTIFEKLIEHLVEVEENKNKILDFCFPDPCKKRDELREFFEKYISSIDTVVKKIKVKDQAYDNTLVKENDNHIDTFPFVIIGSEVEIVDDAVEESFSYKIVHPFENSKRIDEITYLSPVGKALMLKGINDTVSIDVPVGTLNYRINNIKLL